MEREKVVSRKGSDADGEIMIKKKKWYGGKQGAKAEMRLGIRAKCDENEARLILFFNRRNMLSP